MSGPVLRPGETLIALDERDVEVLRTILNYAADKGDGYSAFTSGKKSVSSLEIGFLRNEFTSSQFIFVEAPKSDEK